MASPRLKHGLTSATLVVLPEEHRHEYEEVLRGFRASFNPQDAAEDALVLRLAHAHWRTLRSRRIETGMLNVSASVQRGRAREWVENCPEHLNPHEAIGVGFMAMPPEQWQMYLRYDTIISRDFFKTLDALTKLQRTRNTVGQALPPARSQSGEPGSPRAPRAFAAAAGPQLSDPGIRSVSQTTPAAIDLQQPKGSKYETKQAAIDKHRRPRRTLGYARRLTNSTQDTPDFRGGKERNLRRLPASPRLLSGNPGHTSQGAHRLLG